MTLRKVTASGGGGVGVGIVTEETGRMSRASGAGVQGERSSHTHTTLIHTHSHHTSYYRHRRVGVQVAGEGVQSGEWACPLLLLTQH